MTVKRSITFLAGGAVLVLAALALAACGGSSNNSSSGSSSPPGAISSKAASVDVQSTSLGNILTSQGRTLYLFTNDEGTTSDCSGACAVNWPPLRSIGKPTAGGGAQASLIATTPRSGGGAAQVTYNGHPLYFFKGDTSSGDTNGQGLNAFGGSWWVVSSAGTKITTAPASTGGGGGGY